MEPNGLSGGMFSNMTTTTAGLLAVENPLQQQQQQQQHLQHHSQMVSYHDTDIALQQQQQQQLLKTGYPPFSAAAKSKQQQSINTLSDEEEQGGGVMGDENNNNNSSGSPKRKASSSSPWQRMKWTDTMVRLLIMAVYYIGDEVGSEGTNSDPNGKKKSNGGLLQKKGKWKSVSRAMMEKGFYVSPQQCEDKFNDLNKRYKRVNDILGKGTACRVVENHKLLDTMDLSPKRKEEVKKLLNSKHLFFREMCAYHNSCGHGVGGSGGDNNASQQVEVRVEASHSTQQQQQKRGCFHSSENGEVNFGGAGQEGMRMSKVANGEKNYEYDDDDDGGGGGHDEDNDGGDESEEDSDEDENESREGYSRGHGHDDEDENDGRLRKRPRIRASSLGLGLESGCSMTSSQLMQQLSSEVINVFQDGGRSPWEKKQWMRLRIMQLEEQQIKYHSEAFELEKQRLKWIRFSNKKERDMERAKLENEKRRLESERMILMIRQKELELMKLQRQQLQQQQQQHSST